MAVFECRHSFPRNYIQTSHCLVCKEDDLTQGLFFMNFSIKFLHIAKAIVLRKGKQAQKAMTALIKEPTSASSISVKLPFNQLPIFQKARESQDSHSDIIARTEALNEVGISAAAVQISPDDWREKHLRKLAIVDLSAQESVIDVSEMRIFGNVNF